VNAELDAVNDLPTNVSVYVKLEAALTLGVAVAFGVTLTRLPIPTWMRS
jgi:hypothetical protein